MAVQTQFARINHLYKHPDGRLCCYLVIDLDETGSKRNLWYEPSAEAFEELKAKFGVADNHDLIGRECVIAYEENPERAQLEDQDVRSIEARVYEDLVGVD